MATKDGWREHFRQAMLDRRTGLQLALRSNLKTSRDDLNSHLGVADVVDQASSNAADSVAAGLAEISSGQLAQIEEALSKLEDGTYGQCLDCGKPIPQARLQMVPFAIRCVQCQSTRDGRRSLRR